MLERAAHSSGHQILRTLTAWLYGFYAWCVFLSCLTIFGGMAVLAPRSDWAYCIVRAGARAILWLGRIELTVTGLERLPSTPHVLLVNHASFVDPIALVAALPVHPGYAFAARQEFRRQVWLYPLLHSIGTIILKRHDQPHATPNLDLLSGALKNGRSLLIFPEGGFCPEPGLRHFHSGAFAAAKAAEAPLAVAALNGARNILRSGSWMLHRSPIRLEIGAVLDADDVKSESIEQLMRQAHASMSGLVKE